MVHSRQGERAGVGVVAGRARRAGVRPGRAAATSCAVSGSMAMLLERGGD